jgi:hypothetical protein
VIDPQRIGLVPSNELEGLMVQVASGLRSEDDFRRALLEAEVVLPQHRDEEGERPIGPGDEVALRVIEVRGLRALPAFTSVQQLEKTVPRVSYVRVPVRALQQMAPPGVGVVLNPEGDLTRLLDPLELAALPEAPSAALEARPRGDVAAVAEPEPEPREVLDVVARVLAAHPEVRAAYRAVVARDRTADHGELVIGLLLDDRAAASATLAQLAAELDAPNAPFSMTAIDEGAGDLLTRYLLERTQPFHVRPEA